MAEKGRRGAYKPLALVATPRVVAGGFRAVVAVGLMAALTASAGGLAGSLPGIFALTLTLEPERRSGIGAKVPATTASRGEMRTWLVLRACASFWPLAPNLSTR